MPPLAKAFAWLAGLGGLGALLWPKKRTDANTPTPDPDPGPTPPDDVDGPTVDPASQTNAWGVAFTPALGVPLWPLSTDRRSATPRGSWARGRVTADFGDARPFGSSSPRRHHAGEDLRAPVGQPVVAMADGVITAIDEAWYEGTGALLIYDDVLDVTTNYGEVRPTSTVGLGLAVGDRVTRGQHIGDVGRTDMIHVEQYRGRQTRTFQWPWKGAPPLPLLDPTRYLEAASATVLP